MSSTASDFLLLDCNAFFVSCERVFNPSLKGIPVVVLSSHDGCIVARSEEAKQIGIPMGAPYFQYKQLLTIHKGRALPANFALYADMSRRVMEILHIFCPKVDIYSIDEAFMEIPPHEETLPLCLIDTVKQWTGLPVTIGRGPTKTLAKLASDQAKKKQLPYLQLKGNIDPILSQIAVSDVWGIGKKLSQKLKLLQITTALDLKTTPGFILKTQTSSLVEKTALELSGISCSGLDEEHAHPQSITHARSFSVCEQDYEAIYGYLSLYVQKASLKLREENLLCASVTIFLHTSLHEKTPYINQGMVQLSIPTQDPSYLMKQAGLILKKIFIQGRLYKKVGVMLSNLIEEDKAPRDLFHTEDVKKMKALSALDSINCKYGSGMVEYASAKLKHKAPRLGETPSQPFTSSWDHLLEVN